MTERDLYDLYYVLGTHHKDSMTCDVLLSDFDPTARWECIDLLETFIARVKKSGPVSAPKHVDTQSEEQQ